MSVIISVLAIIAMIVIHEWGHFIAGRLSGARICEFSVGMGPLIIQKKGKKETTYSLRAIPLGGYCAFDEGNEAAVVDSALNNLPLYKRMFIFAAGPFMNILTACFIYFAVLFIIGQPQNIPIVDSVSKGMPSEGILQQGDEILSVNGKDIDGNSLLMSKYINESGGKEITLSIKRNTNLENNKGKSSIFDVKITPTYNEKQQSYIIGIIQQTKNVKASFMDSLSGSFIATGTTIKNIFDSLGGLLTGKYKVSDMSGIVGIVDYASGYAKTTTISPFLVFMAIISINLGIMNLLPIPGLDGSKILFGIYEFIFRRKVPENFERILTLIGFGLLILLFLFITAQDIIHLFA